MPVSSPESTNPILRDLYSGRENSPAIGMNICGTTEQAPSTSEAIHTAHTLGAKAMMMAMRAARLMLVSTMWRRDALSASGTMSRRPRA